MARAHFEIAADAQEEHEHADRLEPDVAAAAQRLDDASGVDERDGQRHRHVHAEPARRERALRAGEERRRGIEHDGRRREQRQPSESSRVATSSVECAEPQHCGVHHRLHRAEARDGEALLRVARFAAAGSSSAARSSGSARIADACERSTIRGSETASSSYTMRARCATGVDRDPTTPGNAPRVRSISHSRPRSARRRPTHRLAAAGAEIACHVAGELGALPGRGFAVARSRLLRGLRAQAVVVGEAELLDPFRGRAATVTAHRTRVPATCAGTTIRRQRLPTVPAARLASRRPAEDPGRDQAHLFFVQALAPRPA